MDPIGDQNDFHYLSVFVDISYILCISVTGPVYGDAYVHLKKVPKQFELPGVLGWIFILYYLIAHLMDESAYSIC